MKTVVLHGDKAAGRVALVDDDDYGTVSARRWHVLDDPRAGGPYAIANSRRPDGGWTTIRMHKLLTGYPGTDHEDGNGLNNQRSNLRRATQHQNGGNSRKGSGCTSAFKGVTWNKQAGKWQAQIKVNREGRYLGLFAVEADAARAYDASARAAFGEFACPNFPAST